MQVEHDDVGAGGSRSRESLGGISRDQHVVTEFAEHLLHRRQDVRVILDEQDTAAWCLGTPAHGT